MTTYSSCGVDRDALNADRKKAEEMMASLGISSQSMDRLSQLVTYLLEAQKTTNLVAHSTLEAVWTRHIADSAQLLLLAPPHTTRWLDVGSGGGFPGLVIGILRPDFSLHLVDSNGKKCRFLQSVVERLNLSATVHCARIEAVVPSFIGQVDVVSARALAPLPKLLELLDPLLKAKTCGLFLKGENVDQEIAQVPRGWLKAMTIIPSVTSSTGRILKFQR
jgi:16S rRNA (guanine527-N7)-methyltransferase